MQIIDSRTKNSFISAQDRDHEIRIISMYADKRILRNRVKSLYGVYKEHK